MTQPSTADYRKYPKGPNFLLIVIVSGVALVILMLGVYLFLKTDGRSVIPVKSTSIALPAGAPATSVEV